MYNFFDDKDGRPVSEEGNQLPYVDVQRNINDYKQANHIYNILTNNEQTFIFGWPVITPVQVSAVSPDGGGWSLFRLGELTHQMYKAFYEADERTEGGVLADDAPDFDSLRLVRIIGSNDSPATVIQMEDGGYVDI